MNNQDRNAQLVEIVAKAWGNSNPARAYAEHKINEADRAAARYRDCHRCGGQYGADGGRCPCL